MERKQASECYRWDLRAIYPSEEAFSAAMETVREQIAAYAAHRAAMTESGAGLLAALEADTALDRLLSKLYEYASLTSDLDKSDNAALSRLQRVTDLANEAAAATFFVAPTLNAIPEETLARFYAEEPGLSAYRRRIDGVRRYRPHLLSDEKEELLAKLLPGLHSHSGIHSIFANADLDFGKVKNEQGEAVALTSASYVPLLMSGDRNVRRSAFRTLYKTYRQFGNTFASLLEARIRETVTLSGIRGFADSLEEAVFADEATSAVYQTLTETVGKNLAPLFDYYRLKKEVLGLSSLHMYDVYTPLIPDADTRFSYEQAVEEVLEAVSVLGEEYRTVLAKGLKERRWVDVYPGKGKRSGAYSAGCYDTDPYILLNFMGKLDDVSTLAHEAGHSMHTYFSNKSNPPQDAQYTIFVAEVASTVNELLFTRRRLRRATDKREKLALLNQLMETYKGTLYRQSMFAEFEYDIHTRVKQGEPLTCEVLCERYYEVVRRYFGNTVVADREIACEWMRIPHFYRCFYVYKYATCISAATAIVKRLEGEGESYREQYLSFLRCGGSRSPLDSLMVAGIDLTQPAVIEDAIADFEAAVREFRALYNE